MGILQILLFNNPLLRKHSREVKRVTGEIKKLIKDMAETMYANSGVGLAAPQMGVLKRVIVIDIGQGLISLINPKMIKKSGLEIGYEGCLCFPGVEAPVKRATYCLVEGLNQKGQHQTIEAEGLLARVFQHEIDHLDGILFVDRVEDLSLIRKVVPKSEVGAP